MCGIAGILRVHPPGAAPPPPDLAIPESWLDILDESIKHRGPDGHGRFRDRATRPDGSIVDVALVHRRLSIIDPEDGHQPMVSPRGPQRTPTVREGPESNARTSDLVAVVFNGCIYNHRDLRRELTAAGHHFVTDHSDTEVLIHGWREWQMGLFNRLDGMFAVAMWDRSTGRLILARDQFGEKPLCYTAHPHGPGGWVNAFASTFGGLAKLACIPAAAGTTQFRADRLDPWLRFGFGRSAPMTFASGWSTGSAGVLEGPAWRQERIGVWSRESLKQDQTAGDQPLDRRNAWPAIERAVASRLEADVPLGCFLSGGVDSTLVAAAARKLLGSLRTFTVRMPDPEFDESAHAQRAAAALGTQHQTLDCAAEPAADLLKLIGLAGLPFGDSSLLPAHWVSRASRAQVSVSLSGDGGDEMFVGYERYMAAQWLAQPGIWRHLSAKWLPADRPRSTFSKARRLLEAAKGVGYLDLVSIFPTAMLRQLIQRDEGTKLPDYARRGRDGARLWDVYNYLPDDLMRKTDLASMACALEVRSPFLEPRLARACLGTRLDTLLPAGRRKGLLLDVAKEVAPGVDVDRPKQGFAIPIGDWFRTDYGGMKTLLMDHINSTEPWGSPSLGIDLNMKFVRQMLDEHMNKKRDHSQRLYMLLVLSIWAKSM